MSSQRREYEVLDDIHRLVRVTGAIQGEGPPCDRPEAEIPNRCWDLVYDDGHSAILRTRTEFVDAGFCVTYVGPLSWYEGRPHLDTVNLNWLRIY